jgi:hypothetical protein
MRLFYGLLLFLSLLVYAGLRQGISVLANKLHPGALLRADMILANGLLILGAPLLFYFGLKFEQPLPLIFSVLGLLSGISYFKYALTKQPAANAWLKEHISALIGTGIAAHTAFFAFGGRALFDNIGAYQLLFWIAPGIVGSFAIRHFSLKYATQPRFSPRQNKV